MNIFFSDNDIRNLLQKDQKGENKILAKQFLKIIMFLSKKDYNPQKNIENYLFEFRNISRAINSFYFSKTKCGITRNCNSKK